MIILNSDTGFQGVNRISFGGVVDFNYIENYDYKAKNPNSLFSFEIHYKS